MYITNLESQERHKISDRLDVELNVAKNTFDVRAAMFAFQRAYNELTRLVGRRDGGVQIIEIEKEIVRKLESWLARAEPSSDPDDIAELQEIKELLAHRNSTLDAMVGF